MADTNSLGYGHEHPALLSPLNTADLPLSLRYALYMAASITAGRCNWVLAHLDQTQEALILGQISPDAL